MSSTAEEPEEAKGPKHAPSAAAMVGLRRFGFGMPFYRQEQLQRHLDAPLASSTQWDILVYYLDGLAAVYREMHRQASRGRRFHNDDTYARVLSLMGKRRRDLVQRGLLEKPERTGLFTTGIIGFTEDDQLVTLFFSGRKHAGENLARVLADRPEGHDPPCLMCDALARNIPLGHEVVQLLCMSHARRGFVDEYENFPDECRYLLENLGQVFRVDSECREQGLSETARLRRHRSESGPVLRKLRSWMEGLIAERRVEPNSGLGKAMNYMLKRWDRLTRFLHIKGAPIDNNSVERALKKAIRHRKNSLFYRSEKGAEVGDIFMSLIHTAENHGANPFRYLTELMENASRVVAKPDLWMPWNYESDREQIVGC